MQLTFDEVINQHKEIEPIKNPRVGSCFSGVGMWELALKYLGTEHTQEFFIEWDKYPAKSYTAIHGDIKNYGDVTSLAGDEVEDIDLFFYSPPCQSFSIAGKGLGTDDARGVLFNDSLRIIQAKQPKICIMENVSGLTNNTHKHFYKHIIKSLEDAGYANYAKILNTKDYGVPQNRERIFIVSIRNDINKGYHFPEPFDNGLRLKDFLETEVDEKYFIPGEKCEKLLGELNKGTPKEYQCGYALSSLEFAKSGWQDHMPCLQARDYKDQKVVCVPCLTPDRVEKRQNGRRFKEDGEEMVTLTGQDVHGVIVNERFFKQTHETLNENDCEFGDTINAFNRSVDKSGACPTITTRPEGFKTGILPVVNECIMLGMAEGISGHDIVKRVYSEDGASPTISTCGGGSREPKVYFKKRIRKLTPKECWRLQGIKDEDFKKAEKVNSNSQLYKQAGNGVSVNVVMEIIKQLQDNGYIGG